MHTKSPGGRRGVKKKREMVVQLSLLFLLEEGTRRGETNPDLATCKSTTSRIGGIDIEREEGDSKFQIHDLQPDALL